MADEQDIAGVTSTEVDIALRNLTKRFGDMVAVDDLTLDIPRGSFFALLGPSGCGKTTTLRMIGGFEEPTAGHDRARGRRRHERPAAQARRQHGLPELRAVPAHDGREERRVRARAPQGARRPTSSAASPRRSTSSSSARSPAAARRRCPAASSSASRSRARSSTGPQALLLDEPLGALDLRLRKQLQIELSHIQREVGITFVHVTHDQEEAMTMADTIAVMRDGRIDQLGSATELYDRPRTEFVANFLGSSNLLDAKPRRPHGATSPSSTPRARGCVRPAALLRRRPAAAPCASACGPRRSRSGRPTRRGAANGHNVLLGHVTDASFLGVSTQYVVRTDGGDDVQVFAQNAGSSLETIGPGRRVAASLGPAAHVHRRQGDRE